MDLIKANPKVVNISRDYIFTHAGRINLTENPNGFRGLIDKRKLAAIQEYLEDLNLTNVKQGAKGEVFFTVDDVSMFNGAAEKGIEYTPLDPRPQLKSLDGYAPTYINGKKQLMVYRKLADRWYIYLFIMPS